MPFEELLEVVTKVKSLHKQMWRLFCLWCNQHHQEPVQCLYSTVLEFLQTHLSEGIKGRHPLSSRFLLSTWQLRPSCTLHLLSFFVWSPLLSQCSQHVMFLTLKISLLLALVFLKRIGDLQVLSLGPPVWSLLLVWSRLLYPRACFHAWQNYSILCILYCKIELCAEQQSLILYY